MHKQVHRLGLRHRLRQPLEDREHARVELKGRACLRFAPRQRLERGGGGERLRDGAKLDVARHRLLRRGKRRGKLPLRELLLARRERVGVALGRRRNVVALLKKEGELGRAEADGFEDSVKHILVRVTFGHVHERAQDVAPRKERRA